MKHFKKKITPCIFSKNENMKDALSFNVISLVLIFREDVLWIVNSSDVISVWRKLSKPVCRMFDFLIVDFWASRWKMRMNSSSKWTSRNVISNSSHSLAWNSRKPRSQNAISVKWISSALISRVLLSPIAISRKHFSRIRISRKRISKTLITTI